MKVAVRICRSADMSDVQAALLASRFEITEVISSDVTELDMRLYAWCHATGRKVTRMTADFHHYHEQAGDVRDAAMVEFADAVVAVYDGADRSVFNFIKRAERAGLMVYKFSTDHGL